MSKRGRPRKQGVKHVFKVTFTLWEGEDDDLIRFFQSAPTRRLAAFIMQALRAGEGLTATTEDIPDDFEDDVDDFLL